MIVPSGMPGVRDELAEYWRNGTGAGDVNAYVEANVRSSFRPDPTCACHSDCDAPLLSGEQVAAAQLPRLESAELFFVARPMAELAHTAATTLPDYVLQPADVPASHGLVVFDWDIDAACTEVTDSRRNGMVLGAAACWSVTGNGVQVMWYEYRDVYLTGKTTSGVLPDAEAEWMRRHRPRLLWLFETLWPFGGESVCNLNPLMGTLHPESRGDFERLLKSVWLLMAQPVGEITPAVFTRNQRRAAQRSTGRIPQVRVIQLRKRATGTGPESPSRDWQHQWIVRGHWRQQYYPSLKDNRPVWIAPHVKGPDDKPLLGGEKVHALTR